MSLTKRRTIFCLTLVGLLLAVVFSTNLIRFFGAIKSTPAFIITTKEGTPAEFSPNKFSLLVWNIYKGERFPQHPLPFSPLDYDFALIQEDLHPHTERMKKNFTKRAWGFLMPTFKRFETLNGTSIYSQLKPSKIVGHQTIEREPLIRTPKSFIVADYGNLRIINVHVINFVSTEIWKKSIQNIFKNINDSPYLILAGDFNSWNEERESFLKKLIQKYQLQEVQLRNDLRTKFEDHVVDYVFAKGLKLRSAESMDFPQFSDHNPIEVIFEKIEIN